VPQAVVKERHHIDRVELPVQFPLRGCLIASQIDAVWLDFRLV